MEEVKLKAIYTKERLISIVDQDGRKFAAIDPNLQPFGDEDAVLMNVELELPQPWSVSGPRVNVTFSLPLEIQK